VAATPLAGLAMGWFGHPLTNKKKKKFKIGFGPWGGGSATPDRLRGYLSHPLFFLFFSIFFNSIIF
jgi:hypothetical protein